MVLIVALAAAAPFSPLPARAADDAGNPMRYMPASTTLYMEINVDAALAYADAMKDTRLGRDIQAVMVPAANPGNPMSAVFKGMGDALVKCKGPISDIIGGCGGEMAFDFGPIPRTVGYGPMPQIALMVQQGSGPRLQKGMMAVLGMISDASGMKWYPTRIRGVPVQILGPESSLTRPVYGVVDGFQVLALDRASITTPIYLSAGVNPGASLAADSQFAAMTKAPGREIPGSRLYGPELCHSALREVRPGVAFREDFQPGSQDGV